MRTPTRRPSGIKTGSAGFDLAPKGHAQVPLRHPFGTSLTVDLSMSTVLTDKEADNGKEIAQA